MQQTETRTRPLPELGEADSYSAKRGHQLELVVHLNDTSSTAVHLSLAELQHIVQLAHDKYDITGVPF